MSVLAAHAWIEQHPFDDIGVDVERFEVFDRAHRVEVFLHSNTGIDHQALLLVEALVQQFRSQRGNLQ